MSEQSAESVAAYEEACDYVNHYMAKWQAERDLADELAGAIAAHGPWMDDQCRAVLAKWEAARGNGMLGPSVGSALTDGSGAA